MSRTLVSRRHGAWILGVIGLTAAGCGYNVGTMHPGKVRTVSVPVFKSQEFRRDVEFDLTEQVVKAIEASTPYKVVKRPQADTELLGTVVRLDKTVRTINPQSDPRELMVTLEVEVAWKDIRSGELLVQGATRGGTRSLVQSASYNPELGESITTGTHRAVRSMARRIVELMEESW